MEALGDSGAQLLGTPQLKFFHGSFEPPFTKATALLYYLAYKGEWCSRDELLYLFYPDTAEDTARSNLRRLLTSIRRLPYSQGLIIEVSRLRWPIGTDVQAFKGAVQEQRHDTAIELYRGELLEGCRLPDAPEFEAWLEAAREELHGLWREAAMKHADTLSQEPEQALTLLRAVLRSDPLDEEALQAYMQAAVQAGQRTAALKAYRSFSGNLRSELGLEPASATQRLASSLEAGEAAAVQPVPTQAVAVLDEARARSLPTGLTSFVGREAELRQLIQLMERNDCRLVTVLAPGGMGKTRLAIEAMNTLKASFPDGCHFVALETVSSPEGIPASVGAALGLTLQERGDPLNQITRAIGSKRVLLLLDNYEHLLDAAPLASRLLEHCPNLKLMVTSRERLNLAEEWLLPLEGLAFPAGNPDAATALASDAVDLFIQRARQVRPAFSPTDEDLRHIAALCRLVEGSPLALELSAAWVRGMPCADIIAELEKTFDFLHASTRNAPERQRSLRATFEHSWQLLSELEQEALRKLSVFAGGFTKETASLIAGVPAAVLLALIDKSLLRVKEGRYDQHPLVLEYARQKLAEHLEEQAQTQERHGLYYLRFVREREGGLMTRHRKTVLKTIEAELPNIRAAWTWAIENERVEEIKSTAWALDSVYQTRMPEANAVFAEAAAGLDEHNPAHHAALGHILVYQAHFLFFESGQKAEETVHRAMALLRGVGDEVGVMRGLVRLGFTEVGKGNRMEARAIWQEGLELAKAHGTPRDIGVFYTIMATQELGSFTEVRAFYEEAMTEVARVGDLAHLAYLKRGAGFYFIHHGLAEEGDRLLQETLALARELGDRRLEPFGYLIMRACERGEYDKAEALAKDGLEVARDTGSRADEAGALGNLAFALTARGDYAEARVHAREQLRIFWDINHAGNILRAILTLAELNMFSEQTKEAAQWLGLVRHQASLPEDIEREVERLLEGLQTQLPAGVLEGALQEGERMSLDRVVQGILS